LQHSDAGLITIMGLSGIHTKQWHHHDKTNIVVVLALRQCCDECIADSVRGSNVSFCGSSCRLVSCSSVLAMLLVLQVHHIPGVYSGTVVVGMLTIFTKKICVSVIILTPTRTAIVVDQGHGHTTKVTWSRYLASPLGLNRPRVVIGLREV
jgi:hypothetical protein